VRARACLPSRSGNGARYCWNVRALVERHTVMPTFYRDFPRRGVPLNRAHPRIPGWRSAGTWWRSAPSGAPATPSCVDPVEERARSPRQSLTRRQGVTPRRWWCEEFLQALEYGMPRPEEWMGIDRVLIMFTRARTIRETILFRWSGPNRGRA